METAELERQLASFIAQVFNRLDTTVDFMDRPLTQSDQWNRSDSPIVQMIFPEDILTIRPIDANYVATHPITDVYSRDQFVEAAVWVLKGIPEQEIAEPILAYVDALVESYKRQEDLHPDDQSAPVDKPPVDAGKSDQSLKEIPAEDPTKQPTQESEGKTRGWR